MADLSMMALSGVGVIAMIRAVAVVVVKVCDWLLSSNTNTEKTN